MKFYSAVVDDFLKGDVLQYSRGILKKDIISVEKDIHLKNIFSQESVISSVLFSENLIFLKTRIPKNIKKELKQVQIEAFIEENLEEMGLSLNNYTYYIKEMSNKSNKSLKDILIFLYPVELINPAIELSNQIYILPMIIFELMNKAKLDGNFGIIAHTENWFSFFGFSEGELLYVRNVSGYIDVGIELDTTLNLFFDNTKININRSDVYFVNKTENPEHKFLFDYGGLKKIKTIENNLLLVPLYNWSKPIYEKDFVKYYISSKNIKQLSTTIFAGAVFLSFLNGYMFLNRLSMSKEIEEVSKNKNELQSQLNKLNSKLKELDTFLNSDFTKVSDSLKLPTFIEAIFSIKKFLYENLNIIPEVVYPETPYELVVVLKNEKMENLSKFEKYLKENPLIDKYIINIVTKSDDGYYVFYRVKLKEVKYSEVYKN